MTQPTETLDPQDALRRARIVGHLKARNWIALIAEFDATEGECTTETDAIEAVLADLAEEQLDLIGEAYLGLSSHVDTIDAEIKRLQARKARFVETRDKLPGMISISKTVETPLVTFKVTTSRKWEDAEGEDVPPAEFANELWRIHVPESYKLDRVALKKHATAADAFAAKLEKKASRKSKPEAPTEKELAELADLQKTQAEARAFGRVVVSKGVKISRNA